MSHYIAASDAQTNFLNMVVADREQFTLLEFVP